MKSYGKANGIQDSCSYVKPTLQICVPYYFKTGKKTTKYMCSVQFSLSLCYPMDHRMPGLPLHHQLPEFTQTHVR